MAAIVFHVGKELGLLALGELGSMAKEKLISTVKEEYSLLAGVQDEAKQLAPTLDLIKAVVEDAELKQTDRKVVKLWLESLREIMYDADDLLDEWYTRVALSQLESADASSSASGSGSVSAFTNKVFCFLTSNCSCFEPLFILLFGDNFLPIVVRYEIAHKIKDIRARLVKQSDEIKRLELNPSQSYEVHSPSQPSTHHRRLTTSKDVDKIYGRDTDKDVIVSMLLGDTGSSEQQDVPVISIVGTGGFGKTTLAQLIYKQGNIMTAFYPRIWVCVSDPFDLKRVVKEIIQQAKAGGSASNDLGLESLLELLCASVNDKRFLLVLDDVCSEDNKDWIPLKLSLEAGAPGSRILVTTRSVRVAKSMGSTNPHRLGQLTEADCWLLFRNIAFLGSSKEETQKLESIGRELVRKCEGVPLAVKTLANSMRFKKRIEEWRAVLESDTWQHKDGLLPSLMFSYLALTPSLKLCFLYCAVFPKDSRLEKDELVKHWMAQGFLESDEGDELEMIGAENFDILASRSLFQDFQEDNNGSIVSCYMHDLVHDFCQFLASGELRHKTVSYLDDLDNSSNVIGKKIRTLIFPVFTKSIPHQVFNQFTCLRTLVMSNCNIQELPGEVVGGLLHLRYLDLSCNKDLQELPETVCDLLNLQTLKLKFCKSLCELPEGIGKLRNLRHLEIEGTRELEYFPRSIGKLRKLRTLCKFSVSGMGGGCGIGELRNLNHLRGTLSLMGLRHVHNLDEAKRAELHEKRNLSCLKFGVMWDGWAPEDKVEIERMEDVFENLQPNANLEELEIYHYPGIKFPSWMVSPLSKVVTLTVSVCYYCQTLPGLGHLKFLETVRLHRFRLKHIGAEFYGVGVVTSFPKLQTLEFDWLPNLETWEIPFSKYEKVMPCLQSLKVRLCVTLIGLPSLARLESLETIEISYLPLVKVGTELFGMSSDSIGNESNKNMTSSGGGDYVKQPTAVKDVYAHHLGNSDGESTTSASSSSSVVLFPRLTFLRLYGLPEWGHSLDNNARPITSTASIMPWLRILKIISCSELKVVPHYMFSQSLRKLELSHCPQLTGTQHCLPPLLEEISFWGDVGVLSTSLLPVIGHRNNTTTYPNLKIVRISCSPHFSLPEGLNQLTSLEELFIYDCAKLELKLEELPHLPMLKKLQISRCPRIPERCRGEEWISIITRPKQLRNHLSIA